MSDISTKQQPIDVTLRANGQIFGGWKSVEINRGVDLLSGHFSIGLTEKFPGQPERWALEPGTECQVLLGDVPVITGYIDRSDREIRKDAYTVSVSGRDKAADLVDCAAMMPPPASPWGSIQGKHGMKDLLERLCKPFGIAVRDESGSEAVVQNVAITPGDTVHEFIQGLEHAAGVMFTSDGRGNLLAIKPGGANKRQDGLRLGDNILDAKFVRDDKERFSKYKVLSQTPGDDYWNTDAAALQAAEAEDTEVQRYRPTVGHPSGALCGKDLERYADWRKRWCRARGRFLSVTVVGWEQNGAIWQPNELVEVDIPPFGLKTTLLISRVRNILDDRGRITILGLEPKEAYEPFAAGFHKTASEGWDLLD